MAKLPKAVSDIMTNLETWVNTYATAIDFANGADVEIGDLDLNEEQAGRAVAKEQAYGDMYTNEDQRIRHDLIKDAIKSIDIKGENTKLGGAFGKYKAQVEALEKEGWSLYKEDITNFDLFYKENELWISADSSRPSKAPDGSAVPHNTEPIVCEFISGSIYNLFKKLPLQGVIYPTAQFLGKTDNNFLLTFKGNGLNAVKKLDLIKDTLKKQAIEFKHISDSWCLRVENPLINAFGDVYFVINALEASTVPEQPGTYSLEMRLTANNIVVTDTKIKRESILSSAEIKQSFLEELLGNTKKYDEGNLVDGIFLSRTRVASTMDANGLTNRDWIWWGVRQDKKAAQHSGLTAQTESLMNELCGHINLCNRLIMPQGYLFGDSAYNLDKCWEAATKKKLIKMFKDANVLHSNLRKDEPYGLCGFMDPSTGFLDVAASKPERLWLTTHYSIPELLKRTNQYPTYIAPVMGIQEKYESQHLKAQPENNKNWIDFQAAAPVCLNTYAPLTWDFFLERKEAVYDLSPDPLRYFAFSTLEGENTLPYSRARFNWARSKDLRNPIEGYIAVHRSIMAITENTYHMWALYNYIDNSISKGKENPGLLAVMYNRNWKGNKVTGFFNTDPRTHGYNLFCSSAKEGGEKQDFITTYTDDNCFVNQYPIGERKVVLGTGLPGTQYNLTLFPAYIAYAKGIAQDFPEGHQFYWKTRFQNIDLRYDQQDYLDAAGNPITGTRKLVSLVRPGNNFMKYIFNYLITPLLNNILTFDNVYLLCTQTDYFPKTREKLIAQEQSKIGPTYNDLLLPYHPYWNEFAKNLDRGNSYTEPDFYLANPGVDLFLEDNTQRIDVSDETKLQPDDAYNNYIHLQAEYAFGDIEALQSSQIPLHPEPKINKMDRLSGKKIGAVKFDLHNQMNAPPTIVKPEEQPDPNAPKPDPNAPSTKIGEWETADGKPGTAQTHNESGQPTFSPKSKEVEWANVNLIFGDNVDLIGSLNNNKNGSDDQLINSRLTNYTYQEYDMLSGQDAILALRTGYENKKNGSKDKDKMTAYPFKDKEDNGAGDSSPYMNFSNTRYPTLTKLFDAISSINRKKLAARRAFPVAKVYFIEEDDLYNKSYVELDDIYSYSNIESLEISDSRKRPASMARITFSDPHGILSGYNQWNAAANMNLLQPDERGKNDPKVNGNQIESTSPFLKGTKYEQSDSTFILNAGLKIKICLGFSNDANKLEEVFLGEIVDVMLDNGGNRVEVVAMGYGAELVGRPKGVTEDEAKVEFYDTFSLLAHLMFEPEIMHFGKKKFGSNVMFGEDQSIRKNQKQYKETFAIGGMVNASRPGGFPNYAWFAEAGNLDWTQGIVDSWNAAWANKARIIAVEPYEGPQDDNIYAPNYLPGQGYYWYDNFKKLSGKISKDGDTRLEYTRTVDGKTETHTDWVDTTASVVPVAVVGGAAAFVAVTTSGVAALAPAAFAVSALGAYIGAATTVISLPIFGWGIAAAILVIVGTIAAVAALNYGLQKANEYFNPEDKVENFDSPQIIQIYDKDALKYNIYYSTIWDIFEEMTLRHPGYVKHPRIYGKSNRMTMFFGLPDQNMWETCGDPLDVFRANRLFRQMAIDSQKKFERDNPETKGESDPLNRPTYEQQPNGSAQEIVDNATKGVREKRWEVLKKNQGKKVLVDSDKLNEFLRYVRRRFKPFRRWHNINSYTDIISNDIEASADGWFTEVAIQYMPVNSRQIVAGAEKVEEQGGQYANIANKNALVEWDKELVVVKKANVDLLPQYLRSTSYQFANCRGKGMAKTYARAMLAKQAREMYKGSVTVLGSPHIRPYDVCMISDTYSNIYGPIEVEEVHHIFTPETGFITQIYPDTFIVQEDASPYVIMNGIFHDVHTRSEYYMSNTMLAFPKYADIQEYTTEGKSYWQALSRVLSSYQQALDGVDADVDAANELRDELAKYAALATFTAVGLTVGGIGVRAGLLATGGGGTVAAASASGTAGAATGGIAGLLPGGGGAAASLASTTATGTAAGTGATVAGTAGTAAGGGGTILTTGLATTANTTAAGAAGTGTAATASGAMATTAGSGGGALVVQGTNVVAAVNPVSAVSIAEQGGIATARAAAAAESGAVTTVQNSGSAIARAAARQSGSLVRIASNAGRIVNTARALVTVGSAVAEVAAVDTALVIASGAATTTTAAAGSGGAAAATAIAGQAVSAGFFATALPIIAGGLLLAAALAGMVYFYVSSTLSQLILDYIADSRAFMVIPLVREGIPMIAGINIGYGSGFYKSPMQAMRQYWMDGGMGRNMQESDLLMEQSYIYERNGGKIDSFLARAELAIPRISFGWDSIFADIGDKVLAPSLWEDVGKSQQRAKDAKAAAEKAAAATKAAAAKPGASKPPTPAPTPAPPVTP